MMVVIRPVDGDVEPVETIPEEHDGSDVENVKREGPLEQFIAALD